MYYIIVNIYICSSLIKDLGILFDSKLLFNSQNSKIKLSVFGIVKCNCSKFNDHFTFKYLLTLLILSLLKYAPIIWENNSNEHSY